MDPKIKEQWVAALRSRKFKQTREQLADTDEDGNPEAFCCLGVLCCIIGACPNWDDGLPPDHVLDRAGLTHDEADILAVLNDGDDLSKYAFGHNATPIIKRFRVKNTCKPRTFGQIARIIERYL